MLTKLVKMGDIWIAIGNSISIRIPKTLENKVDIFFDNLFIVDTSDIFDNTKYKCLEDITRIKIFG